MADVFSFGIVLWGQLLTGTAFHTSTLTPLQAAVGVFKRNYGQQYPRILNRKACRAALKKTWETGSSSKA
ncbi:hypothetical protein NC652_024224 [Populus alba x Populus x berolinensis]|nr:hypothetical protein NC652_024224 [Populus alba x Populus x berolinensis]